MKEEKKITITEEFKEFVKDHSTPEDIMSFLVKKSRMVQPLADGRSYLLTDEESQEIHEFYGFFIRSEYDKLTMEERLKLYGPDDVPVLLLDFLLSLDEHKAEKEKWDAFASTISEDEKKENAELADKILARCVGQNALILFKKPSESFTHRAPLRIVSNVAADELKFYKRVLTSQLSLLDMGAVVFYMEGNQEEVILSGIHKNQQNDRKWQMQTEEQLKTIAQIFQELYPVQNFVHNSSVRLQALE